MTVIRKDAKKYSLKGSTVRQAGFETSIHALPPEIKQHVDQMIRQKFPPTKILRYLAQKYPDINLPRKSALYNYRKRYFNNSLVNLRQVSQFENELDIDKIKLKSVLLSQIKRFIAIDLPELRDRWNDSTENDKKNGTQSKDSRELGKLYMEAVKISLDVIPKLNISIDVQQEEPKDPEEESKYDWDKAFEETVEKHWTQILVRHGYSVKKIDSNTDQDHSTIGNELASTF
jgi:hypothetical protein